MHRPWAKPPALATASLLLLAGCALAPDRQTLATLHTQEPDLQEAEIGDGLHQAMEGYRAFLEEAPTSALTPEAMRRLADLKLESEFGLRADALADLPDPERAAPAAQPKPRTSTAPSVPTPVESDQAFEARATMAASGAPATPATAETLALPGGGVAPSAGPLEAIALYDRILETYPDYAYTDQVLYQKARAYDELGRVDEAIVVATALATRFPNSRHVDEIQFRRGEYFFTRKKFFEAEKAYAVIADRGPDSDYFELALYKLGWALYKQMMLEESLERFVRLLDHKVDTGYDFDQTSDEADQQRIADTYRVISLCFSDLGGAESTTAFFVTHGRRSYEDRIYRHLGEFYLEKLRYADAASAYLAFIDLHPFHASSPRFGIRVVEIYEAGGFPKLVLESKKDFAVRYGLDSDYWTHFPLETRPDVVAYLKGNLEDLANHYHALYQNTERPEDRPDHFAESARWYRTFLSAFPSEPETPGIHYRFADLHLENEGFAEAAVEYERIAYGYAEHDQSAAAGYAAIFAHREHEKQADTPGQESIRREAVASTLRFVDRFPTDERAPAVLRAAVDDLYGLGEPAAAIANARRLVEEYPDASVEIRRAAWLVIAHASFDTERFDVSEDAYARVLALTSEDDSSRPDIVNNLAASIYKQGEAARERGDHRAAADDFLRIADVAPGSEIRPSAEYDAGSALIALADWGAAAAVFEAFRESFPAHELAREATRQIALVYREDGRTERAAEEYERVSAEAQTPELKRESLLLAGALFEESGRLERAVDVLERYVADNPTPLDTAVATRFELAGLHERLDDTRAREAELERIIEIDRQAGSARTPIVRAFAAQAALVFAEKDFETFASIELRQPFDTSLEKKKQSMGRALDVIGALVDYEVGLVTAAATYYMAEIYGDFSRSLLESERPPDLTERELVQYEMVLEEEAYPFEEKAIEVHEKNLELMSSGVFNRWVEKSIGRLAIVMPGRYAKFESSTGLIASSRTFSYRAPLAPTLVDPDATAEGSVDVAQEDTEPGEAPAIEIGQEAPSTPEESDAEKEADADGETAPVPAAPAPAETQEDPNHVAS